MSAQSPPCLVIRPKTSLSATWTVPPRCWPCVGRQLDLAEPFTAASVHRWAGVSQAGHAQSSIVLATIYVQAGEPDGLPKTSRNNPKRAWTACRNSKEVLPAGGQEVTQRDTWHGFTIKESRGRAGARPDESSGHYAPREPRHRGSGKVAAVDVWVIWLIIAVTLGIAEILTVTTALGLLGAAALITSVCAAIGLPAPLQLVVFALAAAAGIVVLRPLAARHMLQPQFPRFGVDALVGRTAYVVHEVTGQDGTVRIGGEEWRARALDERLVIPAGAAVDVIQIDGITAVVHPQE
jgi:membrane protein implicated in regulation of membrane protease activity